MATVFQVLDILKSADFGEASSSPEDLTIVGDRVFFTADNGINGRELWVTDGTAKNTQLLADIWPDNGEYPINSSNPRLLSTVGGKLLFWANNGQNGAELWAYDRSLNKMERLTDINEGPGDSLPQFGRDSVLATSNHLFFWVNNNNNSELWSSDGTKDGTRLLRETPTNIRKRISPLASAVVNNQIIFLETNFPTDENGGSVNTLIVSDGTTTRVLKETTSSSSENGSPLAALGDRLIFNWENSLWIWDSKSEELPNPRQLSSEYYLPRDFKIAPGRLYFQAFTPDTAGYPSIFGLYSTDGESIKQVWSPGGGIR